MIITYDGDCKFPNIRAGKNLAGQDNRFETTVLANKNSLPYSEGGAVIADFKPAERDIIDLAAMFGNFGISNADQRAHHVNMDGAGILTIEGIENVSITFMGDEPPVGGVSPKMNAGTLSDLDIFLGGDAALAPPLFQIKANPNFCLRIPL